jgi:hypothetical protein
MFDCGWADPNSETVGQRRNRIERNGTAQSGRGNSGRLRRSSMLSSKSSEATASPSKPSLLNLFGGNASSQNTIVNKIKSTRIVALENEKSSNALQWVAKNQAAVDTPEQEVTEKTSKFPVKPPSDIEGRLPINTVVAANDNSDAEHSPSEGRSATNLPLNIADRSLESVFSGWTGRSANTQSSWGSEPTSGSKVIQPLSPTSFVTQSTEVTVSPRSSVKAQEAVATVVRISASNKTPVQVREVQNKK